MKATLALAEGAGAARVPVTRVGALLISSPFQASELQPCFWQKGIGKMSSLSNFSATCNSLRAAARQLLKDYSSGADNTHCGPVGATVTAAPASLRMSMGEVRKSKPVTLCSFTRSELMVWPIRA